MSVNPTLLRAPIVCSEAASRITSSAIRDLLAITERPEIISLAGGLPSASAFPVEDVAEAAATVLAEDPAGALQYATTAGHEPLRRWVAERHEAQAEQVVITHGSQQALELLARALVDPGGVVALADPGYVGALQAFRLAGARLLGIPSDAEGMRVDVLAEQLEAGERPALVYVVAELDNPTGATLSTERRVELAGLADRYGFVVVDDDPYGELRFSGQRGVPLRELSDRVVTLGTVSKVLAPGLRVGWAVAPESLAAQLVVLKQAVDLQTATLAQRLVHHVLTRPGFLDAHLARLRDAYAAQAGALVAGLRRELGDRIAFAEPEGGMFLWARISPSAARTQGSSPSAARTQGPTPSAARTLGSSPSAARTQGAGVDTRRLLGAAVERGTAFVPGAEFAVEPGAGPTGAGDTLRLSFATASPEQLAEAARRLRLALGDLA